MSEIERQISNAEARWKRTSADRQNVEHELRKRALGGQANWRRMDSPSRVQRRLERLGETDAAEALVDGVSFDFDPLERVLGASQLTGIEFFERGLIASRAVARIEIRGTDGRLYGYGSGVLISPRLLLTNNHVLDSADRARSSVAQFEYLTSAAGVAHEPLAFGLVPDEFFVTDSALDFSVVAVEQKNQAGVALETRGWCPLIPGSGKALVGERVNIIQHPGGERMQVTVRENTILAVIEDFIQYSADTKPGSSGAPVFNEQWEMAALHHAGVPRRDPQNRILMRNGNPWTGLRKDVDKIDWASNEGVRISRIAAHVSSLSLGVAERALWDAAFAPPRPLDLWDLFGPKDIGGDLGERSDASPTMTRDEDGTTNWYFRLSFGPAGMSGNAAEPRRASRSGSADHPPPVRDAKPPRQQPPSQDKLRDLAEQIVSRFGHDGPYYDADDDTQAKTAYWDGFDWSAKPAKLFQAIQTRLESTHDPHHSYSRARHEFLYPAIDLRPDGKLRNIYSGSSMEPEEAIASELAAVLPLAEARGLEIDTGSRRGLELLLESDRFWDELESEARLAFNCEHVVCQSWFDKRMPMKSDLHHLFACEPGCNSFRSNIPYWQFSPEEEVERDLCGRREDDKFEPEYGKGPAARATLYFLVRYPGEVGGADGELAADRLGVLLDWHAKHPVEEYERHRNWLTQRAQGNRNPFIDCPDAAGEALLRMGFAGV